MNFFTFNSKFFQNSFFYKVHLLNNFFLETSLISQVAPRNLNTMVYKNLMKLDLLFSFFVYKVDKHIFKNSRGKSGKFTFVWKYIPPYKRFSFISHWIMREVRITPGKNLIKRLEFVLDLALNRVTSL